MKKTWEDTKCRSQHSAANREGPPGNAATLAAGIPTHPLSYPDSLRVECWLRFMPDPAEQLQRLYLAGFAIETFELFPRAVGVVREGCMAMLEATPAGLRMIGAPGWRMGQHMGVLVEQAGRPVFQYKSEVVEATPQRLQALGKFREDLERVIGAAEQAV